MAVTATVDVLAEAVGEAVGITAVIEAMRGHAGHARMQMFLRVQNPGFSVKEPLTRQQWCERHVTLHIGLSTA